MNTLASILLIFGLGSTALVVVVLILILYFLPAFIARDKEHFTGILLVNIFLGWTFLGWIGALVWAVSDSNKNSLSRPIVNVVTPPPETGKKFKCKFCEFEYYEIHTFCPVCDKDEHGLTLEDYRNKASQKK